jgi:hypothetical protein
MCFLIRWLIRRRYRHRYAAESLSYVVVTTDSFEGMRRSDCEAWDKRNERVHARRQHLLRLTEGHVLVADESAFELPRPSNTQRYDDWRLQTKLVPAQEQAAAVEALMCAGVAVADIVPWDAIAQADGITHDDDGPQDDDTSTTTDNGYAYYVNPSAVTHAMCAATDKRNAAAHRRRSLTNLYAHQACSPMAWAYIRDVPSVHTSNVELRSAALRRNVLVFAVQQTQAVAALCARGLRQGWHYEPQNAVALAAAQQCDKMVRWSPPPPPSAPPSHAPDCVIDIPSQGLYPVL